jgi:hypothetical protein
VRGLEAKRRDQALVTQKLQAGAMINFFLTRDVSAVRAYLQRAWGIIRRGGESEVSFIVANEIKRDKAYTGKGTPAVALERRNASRDPMALVPHGYRKEFVIVQRQGADRSKLKCDRSRDPLALVASKGMTLNGLGRLCYTPEAAAGEWLDFEEYLAKQVNPPLDRTVGLIVGRAAFALWFKAVPRRADSRPQFRARAAAKPRAARPPGDRRKAKPAASSHSGGQGVLTSFLKHPCSLCGEPHDAGVPCGGSSGGHDADGGAAARQASAFAAAMRARATEARLAAIEATCLRCTGGFRDAVWACQSTECALFFDRHRALERAAAALGAVGVVCNDGA